MDGANSLIEKIRVNVAIALEFGEAMTVVHFLVADNFAIGGFRHPGIGVKIVARFLPELTQVFQCDGHGRVAVRGADGEDERGHSLRVRQFGGTQGEAGGEISFVDGHVFLVINCRP